MPAVFVGKEVTGAAVQPWKSYARDSELFKSEQYSEVHGTSPGACWANGEVWSTQSRRSAQTIS